MNAIELKKSPAEELSKLLVTNYFVGKMSEASGRLRKIYFDLWPEKTGREFDVWVSAPEANQFPRSFNAMCESDKRIARAEGAALMAAMGKVRDPGEDYEIDLPEPHFPGGMKGRGSDDPEADQLRTRDVMQNHPELYGSVEGDEFHVINKGQGVTPSGRPYAKAKRPPASQLCLSTAVRDLRAKVGGRTTMKYLTKGQKDVTAAPRKKQRKLINRICNSHGHHTRSLSELIFTPAAITPKYDGLQGFLIKNASSETARLWFREGAYIDMTSEGSPLISCDVSIEFVDPLEGEVPIDCPEEPRIHGKTGIITKVSRCNFPNLFGFEMLTKMGTSYRTSPTGEGARIAFPGGSNLKIPEMLWAGGCPLWTQGFADLMTLAVRDGAAPTDVHAFDGGVIHAHHGEQYLAKGPFKKTVDLTPELAFEFGAQWANKGARIREFISLKTGRLNLDGSKVVRYEYLRDRPDKHSPNGLTNIRQTAISPCICEAVEFLKDVDYHNRTDAALTALPRLVEAGLSKGEWDAFVLMVRARGSLQVNPDELDVALEAIGGYDNLPEGDATTSAIFRTFFY